jgi:hypothetical protein
MIVKLSEAMDVPLRERNSILNSAGFANPYANRDLSELSMARVTHILEELLSHHNPYPAFVLDRQWNIKMKNEAADVLFEILGDPVRATRSGRPGQGDQGQVWRDVGDTGELNIALLTVHPKRLRRFISNCHSVVTPFMRRLKKEALESGDESMLRRYDQLKEHTGELIDRNDHSDLVPVLPLEIDLGGPLLKLCSVISTFGTAQDITANELSIETFYPADELTKKYFKEVYPSMYI